MLRNLLSGDVLNLKGPKNLSNSWEQKNNNTGFAGFSSTHPCRVRERPRLVTCMPGKKFPKMSLFWEVLMPQSFQTSKQDGFHLLKSVILIVELKSAATGILN